MVLAALLALVGAVAILSLPGRAEAVCETGIFCYQTDANGNIKINYSAQVIATVFPEYADCIWDVEVDFGDASPNETFVFKAEEGLHREHTFQDFGEYIVHIKATNGQHSGSGEPCPDLEIIATVTYPPPPPPPPEEPPTEPPGEETTNPPAANSGSGMPTGGSQESGTGDLQQASGPYWRRCGGNLAHLVSCRRARAVTNAALEKLAHPRTLARLRNGDFPVAGFRCHVRVQAKRQLDCRRGDRRVLSTLSGTVLIPIYGTRAR
jgi:hypothetical protein